MSQGTLFDFQLDEVVNVAKVPQRSPFRYPGGKTWLVPRVRRWLGKLPVKPGEFFEPFAGGAIIGLTVAFERYADRVTLVEIDDQVAAVWKTILGRNSKWLAEKVASFKPTQENVKGILSNGPSSLREKAFHTLIKNRTYHGGILADGSRMMKNGENGRGVSSRWYPQTLKRRILYISSIRNKISFIQGDGLEVMRGNARRQDAAFFIDPPYTAGGKKAGRRLYNFCELDHEQLFAIASQLKGACLLTYDDAPEVRDMARKHGFQYKPIAMKNTHHMKLSELLISKDLSWLS